jgi:hypothetical protein
MEVHPPEHPIMTWKQFLIHMATVCLGLLIAIALEQSVEALHRHEQAHELREALHRETEQILHDQTISVRHREASDVWASTRRQQLYDGLWSNKPVPPTAPQPNLPDAAPPRDPIFSASLANGRVALLTPEEVSVYQDIHSQISNFNAQQTETGKNASAFLSLERSLPQRADNTSGTSSVDYTRVSAEDRRRDLELFNNWMRSYLGTTHIDEQLLATEVEIAHGDLNLDKIHAAEASAWKTWAQENAIHTGRQ